MKKDTNLLDAQDVRAEAATALTPNATNGEKIKALRTAQGMSMAELSRRASMSDRAIRYIEAGEREPSVDAIQKIAAALGVTTDYFMDDANVPSLLAMPYLMPPSRRNSAMINSTLMSVRSMAPAV